MEGEFDLLKAVKRYRDEAVRMFIREAGELCRDRISTGHSELVIANWQLMEYGVDVRTDGSVWIYCRYYLPGRIVVQLRRKAGRIAPGEGVARVSDTLRYEVYTLSCGE